MLFQHLTKPGRPALLVLPRPLRPPTGTTQQSPRPHPRLFTQNTQLLLLARHSPRPQLPYLSQPSFPRAGSAQPLARLLSTENKRYVKQQLYLATKWTLIGWTFVLLGGVAYFGFGIETEERRRPTPDEWRFWTRHALRSARAQMEAVERREAAFVDWARVGSSMRKCLTRLEDTTKDGKGLQEAAADAEVTIIPEVGRSGFDVSAKSHQWRTGYFEVLMGCAAAAEHLDGMVLDRTRGMVFPKEVVIGPSNPDPRPVPPYMEAPPREENCTEPFEPPETFYIRILTGRGFSTRQKLDAASSYAHWLEFKGLDETAEEMYEWGVDIAKAALPLPAAAVIDAQTAVLKQGGEGGVTRNLLHAVTSLATHQARVGNVSSALPILLSVLRARRAAPVSLSDLSPEDDLTGPTADSGSSAGFIRRLLRAPSFPPPPPSGDTPLTRPTASPTCEEGELMTYIGEILFATSPHPSAGLDWTRQAVTVADSNLRERNTTRSDEESRKCKECLVVGVQNWEAMLRRLAAQPSSPSTREGGVPKRSGWFSFGGGAETTGDPDAVVLADELRQVEMLKERIIREGIGEEMMRERDSRSSGVWMG